VINDPARQPVLVHCEKGADRTGTVVAAYRVVVQGMSVAAAVAEAKSFGYGSPGFEDLTTWLDGYLAARSGK
jgi:protein tyrosine/serine phosphatase